ncbi:MAG: tetratricopeptide repeat protein [Candidatus Parcubacteria bacterium]|nr:tetratricopeptide repeat protein [Candidatus Parcubacteria bacterium]
MYNIFALIIILICLAAILFIIYRKMSLLSTFDVNSIPEVKAADTKTKILEERIQRKMKVIAAKLSPFFKLLTNFLQRKSKSISESIKNWEEKYKAKHKKETLVTKEEFETIEKKIDAILKEGKDLSEKERFEESEKKYLEVLNIEPKNIEAYRGLGDIYLFQKQYEEAKQTFSHIIKLDKSDSFAFFELAEVNEKLQQPEQALANLKKALELEPNNPKYLDFFISICIIIKNKDLAQKAFLKLKEVNPENAKIEEFQAQIKEL